MFESTMPPLLILFPHYTHTDVGLWESSKQWKGTCAPKCLVAIAMESGLTEIHRLMVVMKGKLYRTASWNNIEHFSMISSGDALHSLGSEVNLCQEK